MDMEHIKVNSLFWLYSVYRLFGKTGEQGMQKIDVADMTYKKRM